LEDVSRHAIATPYGPPSGDIVVGTVGARRLAFLARHGEGHTIAPHRVNYRANIHALHQLGARRVVGVNAVGGIRGDMGPRVIAVPHQIIDYTHGRYASFCDVEGAKVEHIDFTEPYTESLRQALIGAAVACGIAVVRDGVYGATQGPRLETEAVLARELGIEYACLALVANWAAGCGDQKAISLPEIFEHLAAATAQVPAIVSRL
jgi:5'-methylthioinosine phosphorylase